MRRSVLKSPAETHSVHLPLTDRKHRMNTKIKISLAAVGVLLVAGLGGGGYAIKHNADVKAHENAVRQARVDRITRQYHDDLAKWKSDRDEWDRKQSDYTECQTATSDAFEAADAVTGRISTGGSYDEYQTALTKSATKISSATRQAAGNFDCLSIVNSLSDAEDTVGTGMNTWLSWMQGDKYASIDNVDDLPGMDTHLREGSDKISDAQSDLSDMEPVGGEPEKPTRGHRYVTTTVDDSTDSES